MATKITLFTRFLKGWMQAKDNVIPDGATKAVELEAGRNFGWKAKPVPIAPVTPPEEPEEPTEPEEP